MLASTLLNLIVGMGLIVMGIVFAMLVMQWIIMDHGPTNLWHAAIRSVFFSRRSR